MFSLKASRACLVGACTPPSSRSFHASHAVHRKPLFEKHLREQAQQFGVSVNQAPEKLRADLKVALRSKLQALGWGTLGTLDQLRARYRLAELLETAREIGVGRNPQVSDVNVIKEQVFEHYYLRLAALDLPMYGNLTTLKRRLHHAYEKLRAARDAEQ